MILKKPYAFLIKNFRIIHVILAIFIGFTINYYSKITKFFNAYVKTINQTIGNVSSRINIFIYIFILAIIIFSLAMFILMKNKQKPVLFYLIILIYYIILLISVIIANNIIKQLTDIVLTQQASRIYRDIFLIVSLPQYYFLIISLVRGVGFDIKKFNFRKDIEELEIESSDDEEFEFLVGIDVQLHKRKLRRIVRELKYYLLENKIYLFIIGGVIIIPIIIYLFINFNFINKVYKVGDTSKIGSLSYTLNSSYETKLNYNGKLINKNKKFLILQIEVKNLTSISQKIDNVSLYLQSGKNKYYNKPSLKSHFIDIGKVYNNENIPANSTKNFLFVFELENSNTKKTHYLNILNNITHEDGQEIYNYSKFKIKPYNLDKKLKEIEHQLSENIHLESEIFGKSTILIKQIDLVSTFEFTYESCKEEVCSTVKDAIVPKSPTINNLLALTYDLKLDEDINLHKYYLKDNLFFNRYLKTMPEAIEANITVNPHIKNKVFIEVPKTSNNDYEAIIKTRNENHYIKYNY